jgi:hypothetical protein
MPLDGNLILARANRTRKNIKNIQITAIIMPRTKPVMAMPLPAKFESRPVLLITTPPKIIAKIEDRNNGGINPIIPKTNEVTANPLVRGMCPFWAVIVTGCAGT